MTKFEYFFTIFTAIILGGFSIQDAFAYIDPGSSSMFIQVIIGALVGVGISIKVFWYRIKEKLIRK